MTKKAGGFVLAEVLVAIALLTGAVTTLALLVSKSTAANMSAKRATLATLLATDKLEELRSVPFDDAALGASPPDSLTTDREGFFDVPIPGCRRRWSMTRLPSTTSEPVVVAVAVTWADSSPRAVITTLRVRRTP